MESIPQPLIDFIKGDVDTIEYKGVTFLPILHEGMEWASEIRRQITTKSPSAVAIELPETINRHLKKATSLLPGLGVIRYPVADNSSHHIMIESTDPLWEAARSAYELNIPVKLVDKDVENYPKVLESWPDSTVLSSMGYTKFVRELLKSTISPQSNQSKVAKEPKPQEINPPNPTSIDNQREKTMAFHLHEMVASHGSGVLMVCGLSHLLGLMKLMEETIIRPFGKVKRDGIEIFGIEDESGRSISTDGGFFRRQYEKWRSNPSVPLPSRYTMIAYLYLESSHNYKKEMKIDISPMQLKKSLKYSRNLALISGNLSPGIYNITVAASAMVDHDFGWFVFQEATAPHEPSKLFKSIEKLSLTLEDIGKTAKTIRFQRRVQQRSSRMLHLLQTRPKEPFPGAWGTIGDSSTNCSFQPEDMIIENYGSHLKEKGKTLMGEQGHKISPFSSSILDGLDIRETMRRWHEGRIYVQEDFHSNGKVGSVVVIYDYDDGKEEKYPHLMSWYGENDQESDMALYSTSPGQTMAGPEISRCEYGGFLMTYPPHRMWPIWEDPHLAMFQRKADVLLAAALQLTQEKMVVYVAPKPPANLLKRLAGRMGLKIIYMPLGTLPPGKLNKIRHFHILKNHKTRTHAPLFILD
jgi:hypothetical protein